MLLSHSSKLWKIRRMPLCRLYNSTASKNALAATQKAADNDEYWETPQYPEIKDTSFAGRKQDEARSWHEQIQKTPTVEEKLIKINMPRYYGYKVVHMNEERLPYNCLPAIQHYTRTHFEPMEKELKEDEKLSTYVNKMKDRIVETLEFSYDVYSHKEEDNPEMDEIEREKLFTQIVVEQIHRELANGLAGDFPHLHEVEVDYNPRHEAFWAVGGIEPPKNVVKSKEGREWQKDNAKDPVDRFMQYKSEPILALRHQLQLQPWKSEREYNNLTLAKSVPRFEYDPRTLGYTTGHQHGTNIPGYWPKSANSFGFISYQTRAPFLRRPKSYGKEDQLNALHAHAIQSSFAWLLAQANYYGFNTYSELTYPMNTQTIVTNGKQWSFYEYQLNTLLMHGSQIDENPRVNNSRGTPELSLYQEIDSNGKVVGFNDQVLKHLIACYTKTPNVRRSNDELTPFLDKQYKRIADYPDAEKRTFLEQIFKHMCSNRPRHLPLPEIYMWEKIYKIDNKTRPLEAKRRFFELDINPWKRTLDQYDKEYIPKAERPEGPKSKNKFRKTYYP
ncbi:large ribosomal subunit protein mL65 [Musca vetustissima]|uniref:large ribosomal subunit protein mL65 n=1 Tax=Musca vetustissima TaxID=27455 RepID=UPI002AB72A1F|nr:large ribosomal subunit protein mL65 [Musca vetustissima]